MSGGWSSLVGIGLLVGLSIAAAAPPPGRLRQTSAPPASPPSTVERVVSTNLPCDEILLDLLPPSRIAALSVFVDDREVSNAWTAARGVPRRVRGNAEEILALRPGLVFAFPFGQAETEVLLREARVPVVHVPGASTIDEVRHHVRVVASMVSEEGKAEALIAAMDRNIAAVEERVRDVPKPRVLLLNPGNYTAGAGTLFDDLLAHAGGRNVAAEAGLRYSVSMPIERVLELDPDVVFLVSFRADGRARDVGERGAFTADPVWRNLSAVQSGRVHRLPARRALVSSHHVDRAILSMARLLHPERFAEERAPLTRSPGMR